MKISASQGSADGQIQEDISKDVYLQTPPHPQKWHLMALLTFRSEYLTAGLQSASAGPPITQALRGSPRWGFLSTSGHQSQPQLNNCRGPQSVLSWGLSLSPNPLQQWAPVSSTHPIMCSREKPVCPLHATVPVVLRICVQVHPYLLQQWVSEIQSEGNLVPTQTFLLPAGSAQSFCHGLPGAPLGKLQVYNVFLCEPKLEQSTGWFLSFFSGPHYDAQPAL